jgi:nitrite reductase/ring-hydroxylating ferredoxin subunit
MLTEVAVYRRTVHAGIASVWENVLDWEHLPWLHRTTFSSIERLASGPRGWRARIGLQPGRAEDSVVVDLRLDRAESRYLALTTEGPGAGTEIWTHLTPTGEGHTNIAVRFLAPGVASEHAAAIGAAYTHTYTRLWDEDEGMMMRREAVLARPSDDAAPVSGPIPLGRLAAVRARLPLLTEIDGRSYRVIEIGGELIAHATICAHMFGPLDEAVVEDGCLRCPWHGYRFDARTGRCADGRPLRLPPAPRVAIDEATTEVSLTFD